MTNLFDSPAQPQKKQRQYDRTIEEHIAWLQERGRQTTRIKLLFGQIKVFPYQEKYGFTFGSYLNPEYYETQEEAKRAAIKWSHNALLDALERIKPLLPP